MIILQSLWRGPIEVYTTPPGEWKEIVREVAEEHCVTVKEIMARDNSRRVSHARQECFSRVYDMRFCDGSRRFSTLQVGRLFGRDSTTILFGIDQHKRRNRNMNFPGGNPKSDASVASLNSSVVG